MQLILMHRLVCLGAKYVVFVFSKDIKREVENIANVPPPLFNT